MAIMDTLRNKVIGWLMAGNTDQYTKRIEAMDLRYNYYAGNHRRQLKVKMGQADDNIEMNFTGLVVERSVSMLFGEEVEFDMGENQDEIQQYIDDVWEANKKNILLHRLAQHGAISGTAAVKIIPDGVEMRARENVYVPRLVAIDPRWLTVETEPEDIETVVRYVIQYTMTDQDGEEVQRKEVTERNLAVEVDPEDGSMYQTKEVTSWTITNWIMRKSARWEQLGEPIDWSYEFPPIIHWQNLPQPGDCYGQSDIEDIIALQDRINFLASNISKIIRYHAHPKTIGTGFKASDLERDASVDAFWTIPNEAGKLFNLEMQSDLASSQAYLAYLRQCLFDTSRTVDIGSMADKIGALTNFGLRVLYLDGLAKLHTKQVLYGEALTEINHRLLVIAEIAHTEAGEVIWPDPLPTSDTEETAAIKADIELGILSKQSASTIRGYDWELEQDRLQEEQAAGDSLGATLLRAFNQGANNNAIQERSPEEIPVRNAPEAGTPLGEEVR